MGLGKGNGDAMLLRLGIDHGLAFAQDFAQRSRFQRQRQFPGLDPSEVEDFVNQVEQMPTRLEDLVDAFLLSG